MRCICAFMLQPGPTSASFAVPRFAGDQEPRVAIFMLSLRPLPGRSDQIDRRKMLRLAGCSLVATWTMGQPATAEIVGEVASLQGEASTEAEGKHRVLSVGGEIHLNEVVSTAANSRLALRLGRRTNLRLGANTRLRIDRYIVDAGGDFELLDGVIMFDHTSGATPFNGTFRSLYGLIAVRGTRFYAGPSRGTFAVLVGSGRVELTAGGRTVIVGPQEGSDIARPGDTPSKPARWKHARVLEMLRSVK